MESNNQPQFRQTLKVYPRFAFGVILGLFIALLSTPEGVLFTLFGALLSWAIGIPLGLAITIGLYTITYIAGTHIKGFMGLVNSKSSLFLRIISDRHGRQ